IELCYELGERGHEDMDLMALLGDALEESQALYDRGFQKYNEICDLQKQEDENEVDLMIFMDEVLHDLMPIREAMHVAYEAPNE
ncbi:hypothetical protein GOP47_0028050, partial [Adiantum capillus-veneris]